MASATLTKVIYMLANVYAARAPIDPAAAMTCAVESLQRVILEEVTLDEDLGATSLKLDAAQNSIIEMEGKWHKDIR